VKQLAQSSDSNAAIRQAAHRMFAEFAADVAFVVSDAGVIEHANFGALALFDAATSGLNGRDLFALVDAGSHGGLTEAMQQAFAGLPTETLIAVHAADGELVPLQTKIFLDSESQKLWLVAFDLSKTDTLTQLTLAYQADRMSTMARALHACEFVVHYQPIVLRDGSIKGCEALTRWRQPDGSFIPPLEFIPLAERTGFIVELGEYVLRESLQQLNRYDSEGLDGLYMSVNVSPRQLEHPDFEAMLARALAETGVAPSRLALEVTEGVSVVDPVLARTLLNRIATTGVHIALDDYGTGYAGMSYLKNFNVSTVKIDKSFVEELEDDDASGILIKAFVELTKKLGVKTIAEGVETPMQAQYLRAMNVDLLQGYLFGRPMAPDELLSRYGVPRRTAAG
jgi:EAL domain-containing protein (putative c-di-GMP-specific phosphodiesterase class I)